jgi:hypothetical protein
VSSNTCIEDRHVAALVGDGVLPNACTSGEIKSSQMQEAVELELLLQQELLSEYKSQQSVAEAMPVPVRNDALLQISEAALLHSHQTTALPSLAPASSRLYEQFVSERQTLRVPLTPPNASPLFPDTSASHAIVIKPLASRAASVDAHPSASASHLSHLIESPCPPALPLFAGVGLLLKRDSRGCLRVRRVTEHGPSDGETLPSVAAMFIMQLPVTVSQAALTWVTFYLLLTA